MGLYYKKKKIAGINFLPRLTLAEYNNLTVKPKYWIRTDTPDEYLRLNATNVSYDNNTNVKDKIDEVEDEIADNSWKREEIVYSGLANDSSTGYYIMLDSNILTTLNATRILSATVIGFNGFGSVAGIIPNVVLDVDGSRATMPFIRGTIFSGASIKVRYIYQ